MITITKQDNGVLFTFQDSDKYLYGNGTIEVPFNSLSIIADESDMITLKKAASNDVFLSARYDTDLGYRSKDDAIDDLKGMLFAETGGGSGSGVTPSDVQTMIDESISGKADTTYVNQIATQATEAITALTQTVSNNYTEHETEIESLYADKFGYASYDSQTQRINFYSRQDSPTVLAYVDATAFIKDGMVSNVEIVNGNLVITFNSDAGKQPISIPLTDIFNPANYYTTGQTDALLAAKADTATTYTKTEVDAALSEKVDTSAVTAVNDALTAHTANTTVHVTQVEKDAWNAKVDTSAITTAITSGSTDAEIPTAKAVYDATQSGGGGATYAAGTNISIDSANTINCTIPFDYNTGYDRYNLGTGITNASSSLYSIAIGSNVTLKGNDGVAIGHNAIITGTSANAVVIGVGNKAKKGGSVVIGSNSISDVAQGVAIGTAVYVTGTTKMNLNNQIKVDTNNQVYIKDKDNVNEVCIQDAIAALGGLKFVQCSQSEYDAMVSGGTIDSSTIYFITNVVS